MANKNHKVKQKKTFPIWGWGMVAIILIAIIGIFVSQQLRTPTAAYPADVTVTEAAQKRDQGAFMLDVREPSEWVQFHIPGATLIPLGELSNRISELPKDKEIVVVCRSGNRSAQGRDILLNAGFTKVTSMSGGITQWKAQGLPTTSGQ